MKRLIQRGAWPQIRVLLLVSVCMTLIAGSAGAFVVSEFTRGIEYEDYMELHAEAPRPDREVIVDASHIKAVELDEWELVEDFEGVPGTSLKTGERGWVEWEFEVEEAGLYTIELKYFPIPGRSSAIERELWINGEVPFLGAQYLTFSRVWADEGPVRVDSLGNQIRARQIESPMWRTSLFWDAMGYQARGYQFYFEEGLNTIRFTSRREPLMIHHLRLFQEPVLPTYAELRAYYDAMGYQPVRNQFIEIQGQDATFKSTSTLFPVFDQGDPTAYPYHPAEIRMNSIGGHRWALPGQWITWQFEVPESGLYQIAIKGKQDQLRGVWASRRLMINGQVPFQEADAVRFPFDQHYEMIRLSDENGDPALVYLEEGLNELTLEVVLGDMAEFLRVTQVSLYELTTIYRRILMITSATPDPLRDYQLDTRIPDIIERIAVQADVMESLAREFEEATGQRGGHTRVLSELAILLRNMSRDTRIIPRTLPQYRDYIGGLGTWIMRTREQPLMIDRIIVASEDQRLPNPKPTIWQVLWHEARAFLASLTFDYDTIGDLRDPDDFDIAEDQQPLRVWIGTGRDQAQTLKQMIEDTFTPMTGIPVQLELIANMQGILIPATLMGTGPDVALGLPVGMPINFAIRGALADLSQFDDFEEVAQRFKRSALVPFRFRDRVYALPDDQPFLMMFYRKDILTELGLEVPQTWDDVKAIIPELQKNYMDFGLGGIANVVGGAADPNNPSAPLGGQAGGDLGSMMMLMYQRRASLYLEDGIEVNLNSEVAVDVFRELTDFFSLYNLPLAFNAQNRFRMGEMPLVIAAYNMYNFLQVFAPELRGEWDFTLVPGTLEEDGTINRTVPVGTIAAILMEHTEMQEEGWEFLKWWTSTESQVRFGLEMESLMGAAARYATANVEAMQQLPWSVDNLEVLLEQWEWTEGVPEVPGGYYVGRQFDWAFRAVVLRNEPLRETLEDYTRMINEELAIKRAEFGLELSIDELDERYKDLFWSHFTHVRRPQ